MSKFNSVWLPAFESPHKVV